MRERRRQQATRLQVPRRAVAATFALFLLAGTLAVAASDEFGPITAVVVLVGGLFLIISALMVDSIADSWSDGPKLTCILHEFPDRDMPDCPLDHFSNSGCTAAEIELHVLKHHEEDYNRNNKILMRVRGAVAFHIFVALVGIAVVINGMFEAIAS